MEIAARETADFAISDDLVEAAGPESAPHRSGRLHGPLIRVIRGRAEPLRVWFWRQPDPDLGDLARD
jgi:adenylate cyclase